MKLKTKYTFCIRRKANVKKIDDAIDLLEKQIKDLIVKEKNSNDAVEIQKIKNEIDLYTKLLSGAVIVWCESLIKALFYEYGAFKEEQINELLSREKSLAQKWTLALSTAFFNAFSGIQYNSNNPLSNKQTVQSLTRISSTTKQSFLDLYDLIENKLDPSIKIRNKIQHGDWVFSFKEAKFNTVSGIRTLIQRPAYDRITTTKVIDENLLTLRLKRNQFKLIYSLISDLAIFKRHGRFREDNSSNPFEYNFNKSYCQILSNQNILVTSDFEKYKIDLASSRNRGQIWKKKNKKSRWLNKFLAFLKLKN